MVVDAVRGDTRRYEAFFEDAVRRSVSFEFVSARGGGCFVTTVVAKIRQYNSEQLAHPLGILWSVTVKPER